MMVRFPDVHIHLRFELRASLQCNVVYYNSVISRIIHYLSSRIRIILQYIEDFQSASCVQKKYQNGLSSCSYIFHMLQRFPDIR